MKNLVMQSGRNLPVTAPYDVASGDGCLVGALFGVASSAALTGARVVIDTGGVYALAKTAGQTFAQGAKVYWDDTAKSVTGVSTDNVLIGATTQAAASGAATANTKLTGQIS
jgi:predicted RecA/RadA family phage recombinase